MTAQLELIRGEYELLQSKYTECQKRYETLLAEHPNAKSDELHSTFTGRLVSIIRELHGQQKYSDLDIVTEEQRIRGHRLVFVAHTDYFGDLEDVEEVQFPTSYAVTNIILKWMYSGVLEDQWGETFLLDVMKGAAIFRLSGLAKRCEEMLITRIDVENSIKLYQAAESLEFVSLRDACAKFIANSWSQFDAKHFQDVEANLLYRMLKSHSEYLVHSIVGLKRKDVLSLFLKENESQLTELLNTTSNENLFPLDVALNSNQFDVAEILCANGSDVNQLDSNGRSFISKAIESGNVQSCEFLVANGANVNYVNEETGETLIHDLAKSATVQQGISEFCMSNIDRFDLNTRDKHGRTPLLVAIEHKNQPIFNLILEQSNVDVNLPDNEGRTPLKEALFGCHDLEFALSMATKLVEQHGADVNYIDSNGNSYMHTAALHGNFAAVQFLAKQKFDINKKNKKGSTVLHCFLSSLSSGGKIDDKQMDILKVLLKSGADPTIIEDETGFSALHFAVQRNQLEVLSCLLETSDQRLPLNVLDQEGRSPLWCALIAGKFQAAKLLVDHGADVDEENDEQDVLLVRAIRLKRDDIVQFLLQNRANSTIKARDGSIPLHLAVEAGMTSTCDSLCRLGTDLNTPHPKTGLPAIWIALKQEDYGMSQVLISHGCDIEAWTMNADGVDETLLHRAIDERNEKAAIFLIKNGSDVNAVRKSLNENDPTQQTPLHLSVQWGLMEVAKALDENGRTAAHIAIIEQDQEVTELLLSHPNPSACFSVRDKWGQTPLSIAMKNRNNKAAELICKRIPQQLVQVNGNGENLLHVAIKANDFESVLFLLGLQIDVNIPVQNEIKSTPLHICAEFGSEIVMRNLLLAGAVVDTQNELGQTPMHVAAIHDRADLLEVLLNEPNGDPNIVDNEGNNAVHCSVLSGHIKTTQFLLLESEINPVKPLAETKYRSLVRRNHWNYGQKNIWESIHSHNLQAAELFQTIIECYPNFPLEATDIYGNTVFLLSFINGNAELCKLLLKYGVCLGAANHQGDSIFKISTPTKQLLFDLLNGLDREPKWTTDGEFCSECESKFTITMRRHHCRHCGRLICSKCSEQQIPILKYNLSKSVRVCQMCFTVLTMNTKEAYD
ncbi:hypothetical protein M3Y98_00613900 [Aphelenchoides besseyi]|nr:hypothetical protein M3Y98_00613900 [Aphelenchoides besseyi]